MELDVFRGRPLRRASTVSCAPIAIIERRGNKLKFLNLGDSNTGRWKHGHPRGEFVDLFDHPRVLLAKAEAIEAVGFFLRSHVRKWPLSPIVVMHQLDGCDGGLSVLELRILNEIAVDSLGGRAFILGTPSPLDVRHIEMIAQS